MSPDYEYEREVPNAMNPGYVVRMVLPDGVHALEPSTRELLEALDKMGVIVLHTPFRTNPVGNEDYSLCFDVKPPADEYEDTWTWAMKAAVRATNAGYNAVKAPACPRQ